MNATPDKRTQPSRRRTVLGALLAYLVVACAVQVQDPSRSDRYRWWSGLGPVLPHDSFPSDCSLCHVGEKWHSLVPDFHFDHEAETGVPLHGAHSDAKCLLCHNDRGPVAVFYEQGCAGCHEDVHYGELGARCQDCHEEQTWQPVGQIERHNRTRFPLVGAHAATACNRCHLGAFVGNFLPVDPSCETCHQDDLRGAINPPHIGLGWVDNCQRCHFPTRWEGARLPR